MLQVVLLVNSFYLWENKIRSIKLHKIINTLQNVIFFFKLHSLALWLLLLAYDTFHKYTLLSAKTLPLKNIDLETVLFLIQMVY